MPDAGSPIDLEMQELVRQLAHEVRNPLATIKSGIQLARRVAEIPAKADTYLLTAMRQVDRVDGTIRKMHRFVRLEAGSFLPVVVGELVAMTIRSVEQDGSTVEKRPAIDVVGSNDQADAWVWCDPRLGQQALEELLSNALRATPPEGRVTIHWERLPGAGLLSIDVIDGGGGVATDISRNMFRPFFSSFPTGTGLGLNIAQKAAKLCGGEIRWTNLDGGGARFSLVLREPMRNELPDR